MGDIIDFCAYHASKSPRILIVENDADVRDIAESALTDAGHRVLVAEGGMAAFRLLERHPEIALMFVDIMMPRINGLMLADMARMRRPEIRVLYTTGYGDAVSRQPGYRYGRVLPKPYRPRQLVAAVEHALRSPPEGRRPA
ncbi:MAG TPA: response regulator [Candidatus Sulfotelmatobacter sp.]|nr:response regulator [Candidatus Sulfotelmatobacter sp.]